MDEERLGGILTRFRNGDLSLEEVLHTLKDLPFQDLSFAKLDHHRALRTAVPEVILAQSKTTDEVVRIARAMVERSGRALITRATEDVYRALDRDDAIFYDRSKMICIGGTKEKKGAVAVLSAGTSDLPVAEEAAVTASFLGSKTLSVHDVGVAGIHRLFSHRDILEKARVIIVVAGMEGALPSVVGGLTDKPVVAVPTSVGYGTSLGGLTALFAMLNSCVPGIAVLNIDNGFGAGCLAHKINTLS